MGGVGGGWNSAGRGHVLQAAAAHFPQAPAPAPRLPSASSWRQERLLAERLWALLASRGRADGRAGEQAGRRAGGRRVRALPPSASREPRPRAHSLALCQPLVPDSHGPAPRDDGRQPDIAVGADTARLQRGLAKAPQDVRHRCCRVLRWRWRCCRLLLLLLPELLMRVDSPGGCGGSGGRPTEGARSQKEKRAWGGRTILIFRDANIQARPSRPPLRPRMARSVR
jgi:hypothetical protein